MTVPTWAETVVVDEPRGQMPVVGDSCAFEGCPTVFAHGEVVGATVGHEKGYGWVCWDHCEPNPGRRFASVDGTSNSTQEER